MNVNFNNVRIQALNRHDDLINRLNAAIIRNHDQWAHPNDIHHKQDVDLYGYVCIDAGDIEEILNDLRMLLGTIAMCHMADDPDVADVFPEVYPEGSEGMAIFNPETDE